MKNLYTAILLSIAISQNFAQGWDWVKPVTYANTVCSDSKLKRSPAGKLAAFIYTWDTPVYSNLILCDANGDTLWEKRINNLVVRDICFDVNENMYVAGYYSDTVWIGGNRVISNGSDDCLLMMLSANGTVIRYRSFGSDISEYLASVTVSGQNIAVAGGIAKSFSVDAVQFTGPGPGLADVFVLLLDQNFSALQGTQTSSGGEQSQALATDKYNNIYLLGEAASTPVFPDTTLSIYNYGQFLAKYSSNLTMKWAQALVNNGTNGFFRPYILFDGNNDAIMEFTIGGGGGSPHNLRIYKTTDEWAPIWATSISINDGCFIDLDNLGNTWVAGRDAAFDGSSQFHITKLSPAGVPIQDIYDVAIGNVQEGFAVKADNDFYILADCSPSSNHGNYSCQVQGSEFIAHYSPSANGVAEQGLFKKLVFPNPCQNELRICAPQIENSTIEIYNATGQLVMSEKVATKELIIDVRNVQKGMYQVRVVQDKQTVLQEKFVKE